MTNQEYLIECSIISTFVFSHHSNDNEKYLHSIDLREEYFLTHFHKLIVKEINDNKMKCIPIYSEYIEDQLRNNGTLDYQLWENILNANPFGKALFDSYFNTLKEPKKSLCYEV